MKALIILWTMLILGTSIAFTILSNLFVTQEKNLYEVTYREMVYPITTIIEAKDRNQVVKKIHKMSRFSIPPEIISIRRL